MYLHACNSRFLRACKGVVVANETGRVSAGGSQQKPTMTLSDDDLGQNTQSRTCNSCTNLCTAAKSLHQPPACSPRPSSALPGQTVHACGHETTMWHLPCSQGVIRWRAHAHIDCAPLPRT